MILVILLLYIIKIAQGLMPPLFMSNKRCIPINATKKDIITNNHPNYSRDISDKLNPKNIEGYDQRYNDTSSKSNIEKNFRLLHIKQKLENPSTSIYKKEEIAIQFLKDHSDTSNYSPNLFDTQICNEFLEFIK